MLNFFQVFQRATNLEAKTKLIFHRTEEISKDPRKTRFTFFFIPVGIELQIITFREEKIEERRLRTENRRQKTEG